MFTRLTGDRCQNQGNCPTCELHALCEYVETATRFECEKRACSMRQTPGQCICEEIMPRVHALISEFEKGTRQ